MSRSFRVIVALNILNFNKLFIEFCSSGGILLNSSPAYVCELNGPEKDIIEKL